MRAFVGYGLTVSHALVTPRPSVLANGSKPDLLLVAHGSSVNEDSAGAALMHAANLRARRVFGEVHVAFWRQEPFLTGALDRFAAAHVFVAPLFMSEGYFTEQAIPESLGLKTPTEPGFPRCQRRDGRDIYYCQAVGTHDSMTDVVLDRALEVVTRYPFPTVPPQGETALLLAGHGTPRNPNSRRAIEWHAERIRSRAKYAEVGVIFMEENPRISEACRITSAPNLVVVPFFISEGMHTTEDIPRLLGEREALIQQRLTAGLPPWRNPTSHEDRRIWYAGAVGTDPLVAEVVLARVAEAAKEFSLGESPAG